MCFPDRRGFHYCNPRLLQCFSAARSSGCFTYSLSRHTPLKTSVVFFVFSHLFCHLFHFCVRIHRKCSPAISNCVIRQAGSSLDLDNLMSNLLNSAIALCNSKQDAWPELVVYQLFLFSNLLSSCLHTQPCTTLALPCIICASPEIF